MEKEPTQSTFAGQAPSPAAHSAALPASSGHSVPVPSAETLTLYVFVQLSSQSDQLPTQSTGAGAGGESGEAAAHRPCPASHSPITPVAFSHSAPLPLCSSSTVYSRVQFSSHSDHAPTQSISAGQAPSPGAQKSVAPSSAGHGTPPPVAAVVTLYVLLLQSARQLDHEPTQLPAGHAPSPGLHCAVLPFAATQSVPFPD